MKPPVPMFRTGKEAEDFVAKADLSGYGLSGSQVVRFGLRPKDKTISLRLPEQLMNAVRGQTERAGLPYQRYIRAVLEQAVGGGGKR
jgi:predicted DNA binding CopG/RHH family protein